jgi:hypothetical protein
VATQSNERLGTMPNLVSSLTIRLNDLLSGPAKGLKSSLDELQAKAGKIDAFKTASRSVDAASLSYRKAQQDVRRLATEIAATESPGAKLKRSFAAAERSASAARASFVAKGAALRGLRAELVAADIPVNRLRIAEDQLRLGIDSTSAALRRQVAALSAADASKTRLAASDHRLAAAESRLDRTAHRTRILATETGRHLGGRVIGGTGALAGGYVAARGIEEIIKLSAAEQLAYINTQIASGINPNSPEGKETLKKLRATAEGASVGTIFARPDVAKMMPVISGMSDVPLKEAMPFMSSAIQFAELSKQFGAAMGKTFDAHESAAAAIRLAHQLGITDPKKMMPVLNAMVPAITTAAESPSDLVKVLQYMLGSAAGVGLNNDEAVNLGTLGSILVPGTRAGTSLNMLLTGLMPKAGPGAGTKIARAAAVRRHELVKMGLLDPKTGQLFRDQKGGMLIPLIEHLNAYYERNKAHPERVYGEFVKLFEQRGARVAFEMARNPKMAQMARELEERQRAFNEMGGVVGVQAKLNEALANQLLRAKANIETLLADIGEGTRGPLSSLVNILNKKLEQVREWADANPGRMQSITLGAGGAGLLGAGYLTYSWLRAGPALLGSASALSGSAAELTAAAMRLATAGAGGSVVGGARAGKTTAGRLARGGALAAVARNVPLIGGLVIGGELLSHLGDTEDETKDWLRSFSDPGTPLRKETDKQLENPYFIRDGIEDLKQWIDGKLFGAPPAPFPPTAGAPPAPGTAPAAPSEPAATIRPRSDATDIQDLGDHLDAAHEKATALNDVTISPNTDSSSVRQLAGELERTIDLAQTLMSLLGQAAGIADGAASRVAARYPSRGNGLSYTDT